MKRKEKKETYGILLDGLKTLRLWQTGLRRWPLSTSNLSLAKYEPDNDLGLAMWRLVLVICDVMFVYYYMDMYLDADEWLVESVEIDFKIVRKAYCFCFKFSIRETEFYITVEWQFSNNVFESHVFQLLEI